VRIGLLKDNVTGDGRHRIPPHPTSGPHLRRGSDK
jgi:hypothetical protein